MHKLIFVLLAALAPACNSDNRSSARGEGRGVEEQAPPDPADTTSIHSDSTTSGGMNRQNQYDTLH